MKAVIVFPGQASQYVGMGKDLHDNYGYVRNLFERASDSLGMDIANLCFNGPEDDLRLTENTQPAIFTVSVSCFEVLRREFRISASMGAGHSLGEYSALVCSGVLGFEEALAVLHKRGRFMQNAVPPGEGAMAAIIGLSLADVTDICNKVEGLVEIANVNGAGQIVVSGKREAVLEAVEAARKLKAKRAIELPVSAPFHCSLMIPAAEMLKPYLEGLTLGEPHFPVIANLTAGIYSKVTRVPEFLEKQIYSPVRWEATMELVKDSGEGIMIEAGPGKVLTGLARRELSGWKLASLGSVEDLQKVEGLAN